MDDSSSRGRRVLPNKTFMENEVDVFSDTKIEEDIQNETENDIEKLERQLRVFQNEMKGFKQGLMQRLQHIELKQRGDQSEVVQDKDNDIKKHNVVSFRAIFTMICFVSVIVCLFIIIRMYNRILTHINPSIIFAQPNPWQMKRHTTQPYLYTIERSMSSPPYV
jgi:TolA-binding protein